VSVTRDPNNDDDHDDDADLDNDDDHDDNDDETRPTEARSAGAHLSAERAQRRPPL
jgi:hypothetical protein